MKTIEERKAILDAEIIKQQKKGWQITSRTDTTCQLTKEKKPDGCTTAILILLFVIPGILYLIFMKGTTTVYIEISEDGSINYSGPNLSAYELSELKKEYSETKMSPYELEMKKKAEEKDIKSTNQPPVTSQSTNNFGLLTTKVISDGLQIPEEEVIKLIKTDQLKGKKIGEKYFVLREDFDAFMKK
jgi:hypothetical protein